MAKLHMLHYHYDAHTQETLSTPMWWYWQHLLLSEQTLITGSCPAIINTLRPRRNRCYFADDIFKCIFVNKNVWISIKISLKFISKGPINNNPSLVQIMAWRQPGDKPLSEPTMVRSLTHICVTRPQWVEGIPVGIIWLLRWQMEWHHQKRVWISDEWVLCSSQHFWQEVLGSNEARSQWGLSRGCVLKHLWIAKIRRQVQNHFQRLAKICLTKRRRCLQTGVRHSNQQWG